MPSCLGGGESRKNHADGVANCPVKVRILPAQPILENENAWENKGRARDCIPLFAMFSCAFFL